MTRIAEIDGLQVTMPEGWWVWKYDDSSFQRNQFQSFAGGSKAMDAVALSADGDLWLIEMKDYRRHRRSKPSHVAAETAQKARATLAGLAAARIRANDPAEKAWASEAMRCQRIRIALQLGQPVKPSRLFPQVVDPADAHLKLRQLVRAVDPHPLCSVGDIRAFDLPWQTQPAPAGAGA